MTPEEAWQLTSQALSTAVPLEQQAALAALMDGFDAAVEREARFGRWWLGINEYVRDAVESDDWMAQITRKRHLPGPREPVIVALASWAGRRGYSLSLSQAVTDNCPTFVITWFWDGDSSIPFLPPTRQEIPSRFEREVGA
jgi:hypothetical protein